MPTIEEFNSFIAKSGLKKKFVAEKIGMPAWVLTDWCAGRLLLRKLQNEKLYDFMTTFSNVNNYMHEQE